MINAQRKQLVLAKKDGLPNFTIGLEFLSVSKPRKIRPDRPYPATLNTLQKLGANARQNRANLLSQLIQGGPISRPTPPAGSPLIDAYTLATSNEPMSYSDGGEDNIALSVQVSVPIWRKRVRGGIEEAKHREAAAQHQRRERALALDAEAEMALFGLQDGRRRLDLYEDSLLPRAQQTYESLQTAYATGATDVGFLDVLDSVQTLLEFQLEQAQAARDLHVAGAELEFLLGGPWNDMGGASQ